MWGDGASSVAGADAPGDADADAAFARRQVKFDAAAARFRALSDALAEYRVAADAIVAAGVALADAASVFFVAPDGAAAAAADATSAARMFAVHHPAPAADPPPVVDFDTLTMPQHHRNLSVPHQRSSGSAGSVDNAQAQNHSARHNQQLPLPHCAPVSNDGGVNNGGATAHQLHLEQDAIPAAFRASQLAIREKWAADFAPRFDQEVVKPVAQCLSQFPEVRSYIKQRNAAAQELSRRQKKLRDSGVRAKDSQRKWRECSDRFKMLDDQVLQRLSYIDRTQPHFVLPPLRNLAALLHEFSRDATAAMRNVAQLVSVAAPPAVAHNISPPTFRRDGHASALSTAGATVEDEGWDDAFDFDEPAARPASAHQLRTSGVDESRGHHDVSPASGGLSRGVTPPRMSAPPALATYHVAPSLSVASTSASVPTDGTSRPGRGSTSSAPGSSLNPHNLQAAAASQSGVADTPADADLTANKDSWEQDSRSERQHVLMRLGATFDFTPKEANELPMHAGDVIEVYEKHSSGWWLGRTNRVTGYFPRDYTRELSEQEELDFLSDRARRKRDKRRGHRRKDSQSSYRSGGATSQSSLAAAAAAALVGTSHPIPQ
jgi:Variant SH3 domain